MRRIDDDQLGAVGHQRVEFVRVEAEVLLLAQMQRNRGRTGEVDHRLVDREAGVRVDHLVARADQRQDDEEHDRLAAGRDDDPLRTDVDAARAADVVGNRLAQLGNSGGRGVVRLSGPQRLDARLDDVRRRVEVGFADLQMDDAAPLRLQRPAPARARRTRSRCPAGSCVQPVHSARWVVVPHVYPLPTSFRYTIGTSHDAPPTRDLGSQSRVAAR